ncbi:hypothetical protein N7465_005935, partial [Penicillium sp. CMV-2018d]
KNVWCKSLRRGWSITDILTSGPTFRAVWISNHRRGASHVTSISRRTNHNPEHQSKNTHTVGFSLIERVILSAGAMLIFSFIITSLFGRITPPRLAGRYFYTASLNITLSYLIDITQ